MARFLAIDWDRTSFHLLSAEVGKQGVEVGPTAVWEPSKELTLAMAESLGKELREFMKAQGLAAAPVLASQGRDRVVLKEITYPAVSPQEEPALVRFQATKDLADAAEDVILDYAPLPQGISTAERRALAVIVRRDIQSALVQMCRAAGLKLLALVPRPFTMAGCLERAHVANGQAEGSAAVVTVGERWAELSILQGSTLLFSRSLGAGATLQAEVRRGLAVFANQPDNRFRSAPSALYVVGGNGSLASLQNLGLPVAELEVLTPKEETRIQGEYRSSLAAGLGLVQAWSAKHLPINLASPKEPVVVVDQGKRRKVQLWIAAAVVLVAAYVFSQFLLAGQKTRLKTLTEDKEEIDAKFKRFAQDKVDLDALKEWEKAAIPWIDEFYDLAARFPQETGFKITKLEIVPLRNKERFQARMILQGVAPAGKDNLVLRFIESMRDPHLVARVERFGSNGYKIQVDISRQAARAYQTRLVLPYGAGGPPPKRSWQDDIKDAPSVIDFPFGDNSPIRIIPDGGKKGPPPKAKEKEKETPGFPFNFPLDGLGGEP